MRYTRSLVITLAVTFLVGEASAALDVFVYPSKGQTKDQQEQDEFACYNGARNKPGSIPHKPWNMRPPRSRKGR